MDKFTYNMFYEIEKPTVVLSTVAHKHYGVLENIDFDSSQCNFNMNSAQEISFDVYKFMDEHECSFWDKLIGLKYVYIPQHHEYYKIDVTLDQDDKTVKHITGTSASEWELSNRKIQSMEINTANDLTYFEKYDPTTRTYTEIKDKDSKDLNSKPTRLYDPDDEHKSLLHRAIADRAPDWSIGHVDDTVKNIERVFSVSNQTIYDFLTNTVAQEEDLLFKFDSVNRVISVYDLLTYCSNEVDGKVCGNRGNFTDKCPKCGCTDKTKFISGYGEDSHIHISAHNYANRITVDGDEGNVKNCFKISGGDDLMTATVKNTNPSGSEYIYKFSDADYDDMPDELVQKLQDYSEKYEKYTNGFTEQGVTVRPYKEITTDYYNALTNYYYYKTGMMPRTANTAYDVGHWKPNTYYAENATCYVVTLPSYCYLKCITNPGGNSGATEFDATNVIPSDDPQNPVIINDGDIQWEVVRHIVSIPTAVQALGDIETFCNSQDNFIYFEDSLYSNIFADPPVFTTLGLYVKNQLSSLINPLFKIEIMDEGQSWVTNSYFPGTTKVKQGTYSFRLKVRNTTDTEDIAQTVNQGTWYTLSVRCVVSDTIKEHQQYMQQKIEKTLSDKKDDAYNYVWKTSKTKNDTFTYPSGSTSAYVTVDCGFGNGYPPEYVVVQYIYGEDNYKIIYADGVTKRYKNGELISSSVFGKITPTLFGSFRFSCTSLIYQEVDTFFYTAVNDENFRGALQQYSLDMLKIFYESYNSCREVLIANKVTEENGTDFHGVDLYNSIYEPYNRKLGYIIDEIGVREETVKYWYNDSVQVNETGEIPVGDLVPYDNTKPPGKVQEYYAEMTATQKALDIKENLGNLWTTMFNYLRESDYQNSNYISDGLSNNELIERATELIDKAKLELDKASEMQYTLSDDLFNLLNTEDFAPFKDKFNLGDFIVCSVGDNKDNFDLDDQNYRLRLLSLSYSYGSPESISVSFSNVTKIKNYFSDTQDILAQAKSMSSSYPVVSHQVDKNTATTTTVNKWNDNGLKSALTRIMNNNHEEVSYDDGGIIVKEYDYDLKETNDDQNYSNDQLRITHNILAFTSDNWKSASLGLGRQDYQYYDSNDLIQTGEDYGLIAKFVDAGYIHGSQFIGGATYSEATYSDGGTTKPVSKINWNTGEFSLARGKLVYSGNDFTLQANLVVKDTNNYDLFNANVDNHSVTIGGFTVNKQSLYNGTSSTTSTTDGVYLGTDGIRNQNGSKYTQITNGKITSNDVDLSGKITSTNGEIGGWKIDSTSLYNSDDPDPDLAANGGVWLRTYDNSIVSTENYTGNIRLKTRIKGGYTEYYCKTGSNTEKLICTLTAKGSADIYGTAVTNGFHIDGRNSNYIGIIRSGTYVSMLFDGGNISVNGHTEPIKVFDDIRLNRNVSADSLDVDNSITLGGLSGTSLSNYSYSETVRALTTNKMFISGNGIMVDDIGSAPALGQLELFVGKSTSADWNKGVILRNDGTNFYFLKRNGTSWDTMRPFRFNLSSGDVIMGHNVGIDGGLTVAGNITSTTGTVSGAVVKSNDTIVSDAAPNCRFTTGDNPGIIRRSAASSERYKHDIKPVENNELNPHKLYKLTVKQFKYNDNYLDNTSYRYGKDVIGFVAEDVAEIYPIGADYNLDKDKNIESVEDWNIRYIVPPMLKLIQEQHMEIEELKQQILMLINK